MKEILKSNMAQGKKKNPIYCGLGILARIKREDEYIEEYKKNHPLEDGEEYFVLLGGEKPYITKIKKCNP